jgi:hypothetical protein
MQRRIHSERCRCRRRLHKKYYPNLVTSLFGVPRLNQFLENLDLMNLVFSSRPSELHLVEEDVVYAVRLMLLSLTLTYAGAYAGILQQTSIKKYLSFDDARLLNKAIGGFA